MIRDHLFGPKPVKLWALLLRVGQLCFTNLPYVQPSSQMVIGTLKISPFFRDEEGKIDLTELMSFVVIRRPICLIESLELVLHDIGGNYQLWFP